MKRTLLLALTLALYPLASNAHPCLESGDQAREAMLMRQTGKSQEAAEATLGRTALVIAAYGAPVEDTDEKKIYAIVAFENAAMRLCLQEQSK